MTQEKPTRIMIVDDHKIMRDGLKMALEAVEELQVVGEAGDGETAVKLAGQIRPDLIIMDVMMPGMSGIDACREIIEQLPDTKVVILTAAGGEESVTEALLAGATGYVPKFVGSDELIRSIREVAAGEYRIPAPAIEKVVTSWVRFVEDQKVLEMEVLTEREKEILVLVAKGLTYQEIADIRVSSYFTIRNAVSGVLSKLGLENRSQLVAWAVEHGLLKGSE